VNPRRTEEEIRERFVALGPCHKGPLIEAAYSDDDVIWVNMARILDFKDPTEQVSLRQYIRENVARASL
jgi:hypothetical protein